MHIHIPQLKQLRGKQWRLVGLVALGVLAVGGGALYWYANHRPHAATARKAAAVSPATKDTANLLNSGWDYLPGSTRLPDGSLRIEERGLAIVNQDGSGGQANPPVNLYGTHLQVSGDFAVTARFKNPGNTRATVQLYGGVPVIADEFRIEPKSIRLTIDGNTLRTARYDGSTTSAADTSFPITLQDTNELTVERRGAELVFNLNGQELGRAAENGIFAGGAVWFGFDASGGSWTLTRLTATPQAGGNVSIVNTANLPKVTSPTDSLQTLATQKRSGFLLGAAVALGPAVADDDYRNTLFGNFGLITTENALKWQFVHPQPTIYDFHEADALVALAAKNGLQVHGHTLVFGEANPRWIQDLPANQREAAMLDHIKTVVGHYKGKIASWDVVNEAFDDDEWDQLRPNLWEQAMGEDYIAKAFTAAHAADPNAKLYINDYGLEEDSERWDAMFSLVSRLKRQGVPVDGVGFQAHVYEAGDRIDTASLRAHIQQLAGIGLTARISEMDVYSEDGTTVQANQYSQVLAACLAETNCVSFTTWGVSDRYDWFKDDDGSVQQGQDFLWDKNLQPTPAVDAIRRVLR